MRLFVCGLKTGMQPKYLAVCGAVWIVVFVFIYGNNESFFLPALYVYERQALASCLAGPVRHGRGVPTGAGCKPTKLDTHVHLLLLPFRFGARVSNSFSFLFCCVLYYFLTPHASVDGTDRVVQVPAIQI